MADHYTDDDEARREHFKPKWFLALLRGELSLSETFWIGSIGAQLVFVPLAFFLMLFVEILIPGSRDYFLFAVVIFFALYSALLFRAIILITIKTKTADIWGWVATTYSGLHMLGSWYYVLALFQNL